MMPAMTAVFIRPSWQSHQPRAKRRAAEDPRLWNTVPNFAWRTVSASVNSRES
jgi:hypothetical protein